MIVRKSPSTYNLDTLRLLEQQFQELLEIRELVESLTECTQHHKILEALQELIDRKSRLRCPAHFLVGLTGPKQSKVQEVWESFIEELRKHESGTDLANSITSLRRVATIDDARDKYIQMLNEIARGTRKKTSPRRANRFESR